MPGVVALCIVDRDIVIGCASPPFKGPPLTELGQYPPLGLVNLSADGDPLVDPPLGLTYRPMGDPFHRLAHLAKHRYVWVGESGAD